MQRIGLSATVGNPAALLDWLADGAATPRQVVNPSVPAGSEPRAEVGIDYVGNTANAAYVIASLHAGEKRLVFCESRARCEELAHALREHGVRTFVSHSSLSLDAWRQAERAFAGESDCVIVATSTLELGIDVGDLDRVIQLDAPLTVASFLQRLGRSGRRADATRNALFLATDLSSLWLAAALTLLWSRGYVEDIAPPPLPRHIVAQQLLGLLLQEGRVVGHELWPWLGGLAAIDGTERVLRHLVDEQFVVDDGGVLSIGPRAEKEWGHAYFRDLTSAFTSEPMLEVLLGRQVLGYLPPLSLAARSDHGGLVVLLGGRSWDVVDVDWRKRRVLVEPSPQEGRSRWNSGGRAFGYRLARAHHDVLAGDDPAGVTLSRRARAKLAELRQAHGFVVAEPPAHTYLVRDGTRSPVWWTFAGFAANSALLDGLPEVTDPDSAAGELRIRLAGGIGLTELRAALDRHASTLPAVRPTVDERAVDELKFSAAVPLGLARETVAERLSDPSAACHVIRAPIRASSPVSFGA